MKKEEGAVIEVALLCQLLYVVPVPTAIDALSFKSRDQFKGWRFCG